MLNNQRFDLMLKSYMRTSSFSRSQLAKFSKISLKRIKALTTFPLAIPEIKEVQQIIKNLKIPQDIVWQSYMNSVLENFYCGDEVLLINYQQYETMVRHNKKLRPKKQSVPSDEVWLSVIPSKNVLNTLTLAHYLKFRVLDHQDPRNTKEIVKKLSKQFEVSPLTIKKLLKGSVPDIKLLTNLVMHTPNNEQTYMLHAYLSSVVEKYKLNYKLEIYSNKAYTNLLNQIDHYNDEK